jgi:hypothetical protein
VFGKSYGFKVVSPRAAEITDGKLMLGMNSGKAALIRKDLGKGKAYLLGFCLQDTYFQTYKDSNAIGREQLRSLVSNIFKDAKVESHVYSSNPDIEVTIRANATEGYMFIINHESAQAETKIRFADLGFEAGQMVDIATGKPVAFKLKKDADEFTISVPFGTTRLLKLLPKK